MAETAASLVRGFEGGAAVGESAQKSEYRTTETS
jgi:hypothetical protein